MNHKKRSGYLLMEALISLALLAAGIGTVSFAFAQTRDALRTGARRSDLASCAQEKLVSEFVTAPVSDGCSQKFEWTRREEPFSVRLKHITWTANWTDHGTQYEESFETIR